MDGLELTHIVSECRSPVSIMAISGRRKVTKERLPENGPFFTKPHPPVDLVKAPNGIAARFTH